LYILRKKINTGIPLNKVGTERKQDGKPEDV